MIRSEPSGLSGLIEMPELAADLFRLAPVEELDHGAGVVRPRLELDSGVQVLGVLAHDDQVDALVARAHARIALARPHTGVEAELVAQGDVDRAEARADRRRDGALQRDPVPLDRLEGRLGRGVPALSITSTPACWTSHVNSTPVASSTRRAASVSSGPVPSPGTSVTVYGIGREDSDTPASGRSGTVRLTPDTDGEERDDRVQAWSRGRRRLRDRDRGADRDGGALRYRGVDIEELVGSVPFEKVWGLLVDESPEPGLPPSDEYVARDLTGQTPSDLQTVTARLGGEWGLEKLIDISDDEAKEDLRRLSATMISVCAQSARLADGHADRVDPSVVAEGETTAERFLLEWRGEADPKDVTAIDTYWICTAEHGLNASTFTARIVASTGADCAAALSSAVGALSGPLHGGAPARVLPMLDGAAAAAVRRGVRRGPPRSRRPADGLRAPGLPRGGPPRTPPPAHRAGARLVAVRGRRGARARRARRARTPGSPTACWPRTSSSGRRSCSTSRMSHRSSRRRCSPVRARRAGRRTSWSRSASTGSCGRPRATSARPRGRSRRSDGACGGGGARRRARPARGNERGLATLRAQWDDELEAAARSADYRVRGQAFRAIGEFRFRQKLELLRRGSRTRARRPAGLLFSR